jgi:hypothetical protein
VLLPAVFAGCLNFAIGDAKFPEPENHSGGQNENIGRRTPEIDIGAWLTKGPEYSG